MQPNVRIDLTSVFIFLFFFIPVEGLCCRPKYWANIIHPFDDQNSLTSKCIENWALFERLTHSQRSALSLCSRAGAPGAPGSVPNAKPSKARNKQIYPFGTEQLNGLTAKSPGIQANEGLCPTACARAELGWGREPGCGIGVMDVTDAA